MLDFRLKLNWRYVLWLVVGIIFDPSPLKQDDSHSVSGSSTVDVVKGWLFHLSMAQFLGFYCNRENLLSDQKENLIQAIPGVTSPIGDRASSVSNIFITSFPNSKARQALE